MRGIGFGAGLTLILAPLASADAYSLIPANKPVAVAKSALTVTPDMAWNKIGARPGRFAESWTLDGLPLNDVTFYAAIPNDQSLFREVDKTRKPLPHFSPTMLAPDVAQFFEGSYRVAMGTSLFAIDRVEPATFAGRPGFRFDYSFTVQDEEVRRKGEGIGAIVDGKLYLVTFEAPAIHYYDRDLEAFRKISASATLAPTKGR
jgi:hypothetical protein